MNKTIRTILTAAVAVSLVITVVAAVFAYVAMANEFDHELGYYNAGSVTAALGMYLPMAVPVIAVVLGIFMRRKVSFIKTPDANVPTIFASVLTGLLLIVNGIMGFIGGDTATLTVSAAVLGVISGVYFLLLSFFGNKSFMAVLSFAPPVWAALELLVEYFRDSGPINSPIRTANLTMFAFILLFFAEEIRFYIDRQVAPVWYFCNLSALTFTGAAVFPKIAIIFSGNAGFNFEFIDWCLGAAIFMFLLARLSAAPAALGEYTAPAVSKATNAPANGKAESEEGGSDE